MPEETPTIRTADKDGDEAAKRRRRPALACIECRSRKVRCDREKPCGACTRIRSTTCTYRPQRVGVCERSPAPTSAFASGSNDQGYRNMARCSPQPSLPSNEVDAMVGRYVAPRISGEHGRGLLQLVSSDRPSVDLNSQLDSGDSALISSLLDRIRRLEKKEAVSEGRSVASNLPFRDDSSTGQFVKSKFYGQSHWMNAIDPYEALGKNNTTTNHNTNRTEVNKKTEIFAAAAKIKQMARIMKASRLLQPSIPEGVHNSIPPKEICDVLIECYLRTFEGMFRVLHVPSFRKEYEAYWAGTIAGKPSVILKILLACAIGVPFYDGLDQPLLRSACAKWIQTAAQWLSGPHMKSRLNMAGLQIQILTLLACQVCNVDGDHIWIPAGSLLRAAMHLGLHRDPVHFAKISVYHCEMRRRLWATVLEVTAQSSLDMGMPPMISSNDYDTKAPSNINDEDIKEGSDLPLDEKPSTEYTSSSIQIAFTETLPVRLEIIRLINNLRFDVAYDDVLKIASELNDTCRSQIIFFRSALNIGCSITPFQIKMADTMVRRFVLCLHRPYFAKAKEYPQYHYSRKMCLDTSLAICALATEPVPGQEDDWTRMTHRCIGFFKSFFLYAMSTIYIELNTQIDEQKHASAIAGPLISNSASGSNQPFTLPTQFSTLRDVLVSASETAVARIRNGETNAKGAVFMSCAIARIDALVSGADPERAVLEAAKKAVKEASQIMREVYLAEHDVPIDLNVSTAGKDASRGDGADDVTGRRLQTGTDVSIEVPDPDLESYTSAQNGDMNGNMLDGTMDGLDMLDDGFGNLNGAMDLDAYMNAMNYTSHFARSPEWFYDMNAYAAPNNWGNDFGGI